MTAMTRLATAGFNAATRCGGAFTRNAPAAQTAFMQTVRFSTASDGNNEPSCPTRFRITYFPENGEAQTDFFRSHNPSLADIQAAAHTVGVKTLDCQGLLDTMPVDMQVTVDGELVDTQAGFVTALAKAEKKGTSFLQVNTSAPLCSRTGTSSARMTKNPSPTHKAQYSTTAASQRTQSRTFRLTSFSRNGASNASQVHEGLTTFYC